MFRMEHLESGLDASPMFRSVPARSVMAVNRPDA
jgi:hypothetical protein